MNTTNNKDLQYAIHADRILELHRLKHKLTLDIQQILKQKTKFIKDNNHTAIQKLIPKINNITAQLKQIDNELKSLG